MKKIIYWFSLVSMAAYSQGAFAAVNNSDVQGRVQTAVDSLQDLMNVPDKTIPTDLLNAASCIATISIYKAGIGIGAEGGSGLASCRNADGMWSAPFFVDLGGANFGLQLGVERVELTLVFTNHSARQDLITTNFKLTGDAGLTVGPVGRDLSAGTNFKLKDAIYSYSTSEGFFGGVSIDGSFLFSDNAYNEAVYGISAPHAIMMMDSTTAPASVAAFADLLTAYSR